MRKILFAVVFVAAAFLPFAPSQTVSNQTETSSSNPLDNNDSYNSAGALRADLKAADVVLYVNVLSRELADQIGAGGCEQNTGAGYCLYRLKAEVREVFKGKVEKENFEFYTTTDADYKHKDWLLGEHVVFLTRSDNYPDKKMSLGTIENSTRPGNAADAMRKIVDPASTIDEADEDEPYSLKSVRTDFADAAAVVYADVVSFKPDPEDKFSEKFVLKAKVIEVFKGRLKAGQEIEFRSDLLYRAVNDEDLGKQVIYLESNVDGKIKYDRITNSIGDVRHNILEKLRAVAREKSDEKK